MKRILERKIGRQPEMTLRDYFAAKALPAVYRDLWEDVRTGGRDSVPADWKMGVALVAYALADAALVQEGKQ